MSEAPEFIRRPPRLSMDAYGKWILRLVAETPPEVIERQKRLEERITARFSLTDPPSAPHRQD